MHQNDAFNYKNNIKGSLLTQIYLRLNNTLKFIEGHKSLYSGTTSNTLDDNPVSNFTQAQILVNHEDEKHKIDLPINVATFSPTNILTRPEGGWLTINVTTDRNTDHKFHGGVFMISSDNNLVENIINTNQSNEHSNIPFSGAYIVSASTFLNLDNESRIKELNNLLFSGTYIINNYISLNLENDLTLKVQRDIIFEKNAFLDVRGNKTLFLKAGIEDETGKGTVIFKNNDEPQIFVEDSGKVLIHYNPQPDSSKTKFTHKYHNPTEYVSHVLPYDNLKTYMLVNDIKDLQNIMLFLHANYALSNNVDASETKNWYSGNGFKPLTNTVKNQSFLGNFDGNCYTIDGIYVNKTDSSSVGVFGDVLGYKSHYSIIENVNLKNFQIFGKNYVGGLIGSGQYVMIKNINITNTNVTAIEVVGGLIGTATASIIEKVYIEKDTLFLAGDYAGVIIGSTNGLAIFDSYHQCQTNDRLQCVGFSHNISYNELE